MKSWILITILASLCFILSCTKQTDIIEIDDDFELSFTQIYNIKMNANIDSTTWNPSLLVYELDKGGYSIEGTEFKRKGAKDTIIHTIHLDFVFPVELGIDTMKNGDDFWGFYIIDDNLQATNEKQFSALPSGILTIDSINLAQKFVNGKFNFVGVFKNQLGVDVKHTVSNGTFSFNYK